MTPSDAGSIAFSGRGGPWADHGGLHNGNADSDVDRTTVARPHALHSGA